MPDPTQELIILRQAAVAIRDRVAQDIDGLIARIDAALPEVETERKVKNWDGWAKRRNEKKGRK